MHLPGPLRAAVGLVATAATEARHLPDRAIELPMLAVSSALQASLRAQQRYARLAARGDEVLNRRAPSEEPPPWATFDDPVGPGDRAPLDDRRRTADARPDGLFADRSVFEQLFAVEDPTIPADGHEPVDEIPSFDEPPIEPAADADPPADAPAAGADPKAAAKADAKAAKKAARTAEKAATKAATKAAGRSPGKGPLSKPRHTAPSAFDNVTDVDD